MMAAATGDVTAAVLRDGGHIVIEQLRITDLRPDEVIVRLVASGVCHSDITMLKGIIPIASPVVLGHEGSGYIEQVGSGVTDLVPGDAVALSFVACGHCRNCEKQDPAYCHQFFALNMTGVRGDGSTALAGAYGPVGGHFFGQSSFATRSVANRRNVVKVRADAPLELLGPFGCAVQTGAGAVLNSLAAQPGQSLVVLGGGAVGLSAVMGGRIAGCDPLIVSEPNAERRKLAIELGATHAIDPLATDDLAATIKQLTGGGADLVFDTSGIPAVIETGIAALGSRGTIGLVAMHDLSATASFSLIDAIGGGKRIIGICEGDSRPEEFIPALVDHHMNGDLPIEKMVTFYDFDSIAQAIEDQDKGRVIKPIIRFPHHVGG